MTNELQLLNDDEVWRDTAIPRLLIEDMVLLSKSDTDAVARLRDQIAGLDSLSKMDDLQLIAEELLGEKLKDAAVRSIVNISAEEVPKILDGLELWRSGNVKRKTLLTDERMKLLRDNLRLLIQDYPFLKLLQKANRLSRESGNELQSLVYLCDLRGVYDDDRERVVGFTPIITLQIGYSKQNGAHDFVELVLTPDELAWIATETERAIKKMKVLESRVSQSLGNGDSI